MKRLFFIPDNPDALTTDGVIAIIDENNNRIEYRPESFDDYLDFLVNNLSLEDFSEETIDYMMSNMIKMERP